MNPSSTNVGHKAWLAAILFAVVVHSGVADAHGRSESMSRWQFAENIIKVTFTVSAREATRIPGATGALPLNLVLARYLDDRVFVHSKREICQVKRTFTPKNSRPGFVQVEAAWQCDTTPESLQVGAFFELAPEHVHFATLRTAQQLQQHMLTENNPVWRLRQGDREQEGSASTSIGSYIRLGMAHIATGYDHIAFLLALLLVCRKFKDIVIAISGFTIGHSVTLALGVLGIVQPNVPAIEVTIGLSITLVAMEYGSLNRRSAIGMASLIAMVLLVMAVLSAILVGGLSISVLFGLALFSFCYLLLSHDLRGRGSIRLLLTVLFGLIHGLGFAGAFIDNGLPPELLTSLLLSFNIGVEIGQLVLVALILTAFSLLRKMYSVRALFRLNEFVAAGLCGLGVYLLIHRTYGLMGAAL